MPDLPATVYVPAFAALSVALSAIWIAWRSERAFRAADNREARQRFESIVRDVMKLPEGHEDKP